MTKLDKPAVLDGLFAVWDDIDTLTAEFEDVQWRAQTPLPGWNVHDVVAHLIGAESMLQGADTPDADIDVSTLKHVRNDVGVMNERWVRKLRGDQRRRAAREVPRDDRRTAKGAVRSVQRRSGTKSPRRRPGPDSYGRFMRVRTFDCWMHDQDIRDAVDRPATDAVISVGPAAELALDEIAASMGFVVGKLGGAPDGSRVSIELTGPLGRTINVAVEGRGKLRRRLRRRGPDGDDPARRRCCSPGWRAGARRWPSMPTRSRYGGDEAVGRRVVEHLNYVI